SIEHEFLFSETVQSHDTRHRTESLEPIPSPTLKVCQTANKQKASTLLTQVTKTAGPSWHHRLVRCWLVPVVTFLEICPRPVKVTHNLVFVFVVLWIVGMTMRRRKPEILRHVSLGVQNSLKRIKVSVCKNHIMLIQN
ncbi:hypothetical protein QEH58_20655, partial [Roseibacillus persicicus]|nr:hypothetical protein [Roseibacillus persicicus]